MGMAEDDCETKETTADIRRTHKMDQIQGREYNNKNR